MALGMLIILLYVEIVRVDLCQIIFHELIINLHSKAYNI